MDDSKYDPITDFYLDFVQRGLANEHSVFNLSIQAIFELTGDLAGQQVCDLACGQGYLSRMLAERGAMVTGVDLSQKLLEFARQQNGDRGIRFINDDAQALEKITGESFDTVICNLALMDIPDLRATFQAVRRVLKSRGSFIFSILHPCFETPFRAPESPIETDEAGNFIAVRVRNYLQEGYWNSGGEGMRGRVGAYHRTLSTYFNTLLESGFQLARLVEPALPEGAIEKDSRVPTILVVKAVPVESIQ
jgi:2-polyprenyl-3-methyl-5-hydroxy-6-metoxy-1,4-benzoquinol methylase